MKTGLDGALVGALGAPLPLFCINNRSGSNGTAPGHQNTLHINMLQQAHSVIAFSHSHNFDPWCGSCNVGCRFKRAFCAEAQESSLLCRQLARATSSKTPLLRMSLTELKETAPQQKVSFDDESFFSQQIGLEST